MNTQRRRIDRGTSNNCSTRIGFAFYRAVADFGDAEIAPRLLEEWERAHRLVPDKDAIAKMGEMGLFGLPIESEYGGQGGAQLDLVLMGLALGYHRRPRSRSAPGAATSLGSKPLQLFGTGSAKARPPSRSRGRAPHVRLRTLRTGPPGLRRRRPRK
jgi:alkylation response protein AidB-like acyl-CoA dehydrogenase